MSALTAKFNVFNMQKTLIFKLLVRSIRLSSRETSITHYMQRTNQNMRHFLQQPARCVQTVQFDGDQPWHFSDGKYGLCHHVYWLPADARAVLNHCDVEQDGGNNRTPPLTLYLSSPNAGIASVTSRGLLTQNHKQYSHWESKQSPP